MHTHTLEKLQHSHIFSSSSPQGERRTRYVLLLTAVTMVVEIVAGGLFGSMALLADGWHMATHVAAFMITIFAYQYASKHEENPEFSFGTGKVSVLGGFASAVTLAVVALVMLLESLQRILDPHVIHFDEAIAVATLGLVINIISALLLKDDHHHHQDAVHDEPHHHDHGQEHNHHHHHDHNLRAAYFHVLADALTSLLAIVALLLGKYFGWNWMDPVMGIVGAIIITRWSYGLIKQSAPILLDASVDEEYQQAIKTAVERDADNRISDIHVWRVGANHYAAIISLITHNPKSTEHYKSLLQEFNKLSHVTVEVNLCAGDSC